MDDIIAEFESRNMESETVWSFVNLFTTNACGNILHIEWRHAPNGMQLVRIT